MRIGQTSVIHLISRGVMTVVGFLGTIYFANVLGAGILGTYFLVISTLTWFAILGRMGIPNAVTKRLSERGEGDVYITAAALLMGVLFGFLIIFLWLIRRPLVRYLDYDGFLIFVSLMLGMLALALATAILRGQSKVHISSILIPVNAIGRVGTQVVLVILGWGLTGMLIGYGAGLLIATLLSFVFLSYRFMRPTLESMQSLVSFSKYAWLSNVKGKAFHSMDTIVLGLFVAKTLIGVYGIAWTVSSVFVIFGDSIAQAMFPEMSKAASQDETDRVGRYAHDALTFSGILAIPGIVGATIIGDLVLQVFGSEFVQGYTVLIILIAANLFSTYESQYLATIDALNYPELTFRVQSLFILSNIVLNVSLVWAFGWTGAAVATLASTVLGTVLGHYYLTRLVVTPIPYREIAFQIAAAIVMGVVVMAIRTITTDSLVTLLLLVGTGASVYFVMLVALSSRVRNAVSQNILAPVGVTH